MKPNPTCKEFLAGLRQSLPSRGLGKRKVTLVNTGATFNPADERRYKVEGTDVSFVLPSPKSKDRVPTETINEVYQHLLDPKKRPGQDEGWGNFPFKDKLYLERDRWLEGMTVARVSYTEEDGAVEVLNRTGTEVIAKYEADDPPPTRDQVNDLLMRVAEGYGVRGRGLRDLSDGFNMGVGETMVTPESLVQAAKDAGIALEDPKGPEEPDDPREPEEPDDPRERTGETGETAETGETEGVTL